MAGPFFFWADATAPHCPTDNVLIPLGEVRHQPPYLVAGQQLRRRAAAGLVLEVEVTERLSGGVVVSLIFLGWAG